MHTTRRSFLTSLAVYLAGTGTIPKYLQRGFISTDPTQITARLSRRNGFHSGGHSKGYVDCSGYRHIQNSRVWFKLIRNAWVNGGGYAWARTYKPFVTITHSDWHNMAASFQWYLGRGRYRTRNGFQWYMGYQLAAASANGRGYYFPLETRDTDLCAFVSAPDGTYAPIEMSSVQVINWPDPATIPANQPSIVAQPVPNLVGERVPGFPHTPSTAPILCHSQTPPRGNAFLPRRKPFFYDYGYGFYNEFTVGYPPGIALQPVFDASCIVAPMAYHRFFYVRVNAPYSYYTAFDTPFPTQEPGPPLDCFGEAWPQP